MNRSKSRLAPVLIVAGFLCAILALYAFSYAVATRRFQQSTGISRVFSANWQVSVFAPAAAIEAKIKGVEVWLCIETGRDQYGFINVQAIRRTAP